MEEPKETENNKRTFFCLFGKIEKYVVCLEFILIRDKLVEL